MQNHSKQSLFLNILNKYRNPTYRLQKMKESQFSPHLIKKDALNYTFLKAFHFPQLLHKPHEAYVLFGFENNLTIPKSSNALYLPQYDGLKQYLPVQFYYTTDNWYD